MESQINIVSLILSVLAAAVTAFIAIGRYKEKVDVLEKGQERLLNKIDDIKTDLDKLSEFKVNAQKFIDSQIYVAHSPLSLTDLGIQLVEASGFMKIFEVVKDDLVPKLEAKEPKTKYDVQETARELMGELVEYPAFESIKTYAYENGKDFEQILRAGAIPLRDYYLEKHGEIVE